MPEETKYAYTNGFANGHANGGLPPESPDGEMFLFTSESVGEGHPGKKKLTGAIA
jgi:S-adenosylmethionine synthetase